MSTHSTASHAAIEEVTSQRAQLPPEDDGEPAVLGDASRCSPSSASMTLYQPNAFATADNFFNITRNFAFIGIMALGMTAVIITGGIDLSVGSIMGVVGVVCGLLLQAGLSLGRGDPGRGCSPAPPPASSTACLIAYVRLPSFVVTLGMLSIARSLAIVLSQNKMIYQFGPSGRCLRGDRRGRHPRSRQSGVAARRHGARFRICAQLHGLGQISFRHRRQ